MCFRLTPLSFFATNLSELNIISSFYKRKCPPHCLSHHFSSTLDILCLIMGWWVSAICRQPNNITDHCGGEKPAADPVFARIYWGFELNIWRIQWIYEGIGLLKQTTNKKHNHKLDSGQANVIFPSSLHSWIIPQTVNTQNSYLHLMDKMGIVP